MKLSSDLDMLHLKEALEASWNVDTSYEQVSVLGNPALGQCYPTSRVVQSFFPETEIVQGQVWNTEKIEIHFWNVLNVGGKLLHIDLTWQQFPLGSSVRTYEIRDRGTLNDSRKTIDRFELLNMRVRKFLAL
ncbi:MAG: hypothetical protein KBF89_01860 [Acidimicrobiia bacterium]|jgi:hypothetical protein|nr:hypothetical protein [Acidimicrobiia bacterium]